MNKWYWIIGIIALALLGAFYLTNKDKEVDASTSGTGVLKGSEKASGIESLPEACQEKFASWSLWMEKIRTTPGTWGASLDKRATFHGTTFETEIELEFVNMYNNREETANCNA